jgi:hypothetical protein
MKHIYEEVEFWYETSTDIASCYEYKFIWTYRNKALLRFVKKRREYELYIVNNKIEKIGK